MRLNVVWFMKDELERMEKGWVVAYFKELIWHHFHAGTEESDWKTVRFTGLRAEFLHSCERGM
jgi:hypothetical protein